MHIPAPLALDFAVAAAVFFLLACFLFGVIFLPPAHQFFLLCFPVHCLPGLQVYRLQLSATQNATHELQFELQRVVFVSLQLKCNS